MSDHTGNRHGSPSDVQRTVRKIRSEMASIFDELDRWCGSPIEILDIVPPDVGWNIALILEHLTLVNHYLLLTLRKGVRIAVRRSECVASPLKESDLSRFEDIADPDAFDWQPPKHMIPRGGIQLNQVRELLRKQRHECLTLLESMPNGEGFLHTVRMSVRDLGRLDMYQWLWFLLMHARRHLSQMERAART
jgi:hypothetical protein